MFVLLLCSSLARPAFAGDDNEELRKALLDFQSSLHDLTAATAEYAKAQEEQNALTADARAHALEWLMAYRTGPDWAPQVAAAAAGPLGDGFMYVGQITAACQDETTAAELRYGQCVTDWKILADIKVADWRLHSLLSQAADAAGHADVAFVAGRMALELNQKDPEVAYRLAYYAIKAGQPDEAANTTAYAMGLDMREEFVAETALALAKTGSLPVAVQLLEAAIALRPTSGVLLTREGLLFAGGGRPDLAGPMLERAEASGYKGADLQIAWGHTLMTQENLDEALIRYRKAVAIDPATRAEVPPALQDKL